MYTTCLFCNETLGANLENIARSGHKRTTVVPNERRWISEPSADVHDSGLMAIPASAWVEDALKRLR